VGIALPAAGPVSCTLLHPAKSIAMLKQTLDFKTLKSPSTSLYKKESAKIGLVR